VNLRQKRKPGSERNNLSLVEGTIASAESASPLYGRGRPSKELTGACRGCFAFWEKRHCGGAMAIGSLVTRSTVSRLDDHLVYFNRHWKQYILLPAAPWLDVDVIIMSWHVQRRLRSGTRRRHSLHRPESVKNPNCWCWCMIVGSTSYWVLGSGMLIDHCYAAHGIHTVT
jgi:hypothetical protein